MIIVQHTIVSEDVADVRFVCDCEVCMGACCVHGDAGAPLSDDEIREISDNIKAITPFMRQEGIDVIDSVGVFALDAEGVKGTPLVNGKECAFVVFDGEVALCAIEEAWEQKKIGLQKPLSCHLYPVRTINYTEFEAVNYHKWDICKKALEKGRKENVYLYEFLKAPLIRKYGKDWYGELELIVDHLKKKNLKR
jgi:hypothetical protein